MLFPIIITIIIIILNDKILVSQSRCIRIRRIGITIEKIPSPLWRKKANLLPPSSSSLPRFNLPLSFPSRESKRVKPSFSFHPPLIGERVSSPPFSKFTQRDRIVIWTRNHLHLPEMNANQLYICVYIYMSSR